jgi:hypothetical protein
LLPFKLSSPRSWSFSTGPSTLRGADAASPGSQYVRTDNNRGPASASGNLGVRALALFASPGPGAVQLDQQSVCTGQPFPVGRPATCNPNAHTALLGMRALLWPGIVSIDRSCAVCSVRVFHIFFASPGGFGGATASLLNPSRSRPRRCDVMPCHYCTVLSCYSRKKERNICWSRCCCGTSVGRVCCLALLQNRGLDLMRQTRIFFYKEISPIRIIPFFP